jgi:D-glycero-D-manno-heptose 1,7-bisphosphate phosphatase
VIAWQSAGAGPRSRALFLDRDGVLNRSMPGAYALRTGDITFNDGAIRALAAIDPAAYAIVVATNQSCVGRGLLAPDGLLEIMRYVVDGAAERGLTIDAWYCCPHPPAADCACRKPRPGLLLAAQRDLDLDLGNSSFIGDQETDMEAARGAGVCGLLVRPDDADDVRAHVAAINAGVVRGAPR